MKPLVLITGGAIGIGRATGLAFGKAGYRVIVTDILDKEGSETAAAISATGGEASFLRLDVRDSEASTRLVEEAVARHGAPDCIIANAGIAHKVPLGDLSDEKWDHTFDIDLKG